MQHMASAFSMFPAGLQASAFISLLWNQPEQARLPVNDRIHPTRLCSWTVAREGASHLLSSSEARIPGLGLNATLLSPQSQNKAKQCKESAAEAGTWPWPPPQTVWQPSLSSSSSWCSPTCQHWPPCASPGMLSGVERPFLLSHCTQPQHKEMGAQRGWVKLPTGTAAKWY